MDGLISLLFYVLIIAGFAWALWWIAAGLVVLGLWTAGGTAEYDGEGDK